MKDFRLRGSLIVSARDRLGHERLVNVTIADGPLEAQREYVQRALSQAAWNLIDQEEAEERGER